MNVLLEYNLMSAILNVLLVYNNLSAILFEYHIVGFFEILKFHEFRGFDGFVKFKPLKIDPNYIL